MAVANIYPQKLCGAYGPLEASGGGPAGAKLPIPSAVFRPLQLNYDLEQVFLKKVIYYTSPLYVVRLR